MSDGPPVAVFERRGTGCATSLLWLFVLGVIVPFLALMPVAFAAEAAGVPPGRIDDLFLAPGGVLALLGLGFGVRSHLRTRGKELRLDGDTLTRVRHGGPDVLPFDRIRSVQLLGATRDNPKVLVLRGDDGTVIELGHGDWPLARIVEEVRRHVVPAVARAWTDAVARGEPLVLREPRGWALGSLLVGIIGLPLAIAQLFHLETHGLADVGELLGRGSLVLRGGGFQALSNGLAARGHSFEDFAYEDVASVSFGNEGLTVTAKSGATLVATHAAENAEVVVALLALRAKPKAPET